MTSAIGAPLRYAAVLLMLFTAAAATATPLVQVVDRQILGSHIEDTEFVRTGPLSRQLVAVSGSGVYAASVDQSAAGPRGFRKLFDLRGLPFITMTPRGVAWIESERRFAFVQTGQLQRLVFTDITGADLGTREIRYANGFAPSHAEGLAYLPNSSRQFPDHLVTVAWEGSPVTGSRLEIIARTGEVVHEIFPNLGDGLLSSVAYDVSGRLLIGFERFEPFADELYAIDFNGNVLAGPVIVGDFLEGIAESPDRRIWLTNFDRALGYDHVFTRRPEDDQSFAVGLGLASPRGLAWNSNADLHLVNAWDGAHSAFGDVNLKIVSIPQALDRYTTLVEPIFDPVHPLSRPDRLSFLPDEDRFVVASRGPRFIRGLAIYNTDGSWHELLRLRKADGSIDSGQPGLVEYIAPVHRFAVRFMETTELKKVKFYERDGTFAGEIDLAPLGIAFVGSLAYFNPDHPSGGEFLLFANDGRALIADLQGTVIDEFDYRQLGLWSPMDLAAITTGPQAGAFAVVDFDTCELIVFRLSAMP